VINFIYTRARVGRLIFWHIEKPELIGGMGWTRMPNHKHLQNNILKGQN